MIAFSPEEDERLAQESARAFAQEHLRKKLRQHERARNVGADTAAAFHELGLRGADLPEALGFGGLSLTARALIEEELAAGDPGGAFALDTLGLAGELLHRAATAEQQARWLKPFLDDPQRLAAAALAEAGPQLACRAEPKGKGFLLHGEKRYVTGGARADLWVVLAQEAPGAGLSGANLYVVEGARGRADGVSAEEDGHALGLVEQPPASVRFAGAAATRLDCPELSRVLRAALLRTALISAARTTGACRAAFEHARAYAEERHAFGKPIGHFQAIAFLLADMATELDGLRAMVWRGCRAIDLGAQDQELRAAQAIAQAREAGLFITSNAVQVLGGAGFVQDHPVEKWMRDLRALSLHALPAEAAQALCAAAPFGTPLDDAEWACFTAPQAALT